MARDSEAARGLPEAKGGAQRRFAAALASIGGPQRALLVGELWERSPSRDLLLSFTQDVFGESCAPHLGCQSPGGHSAQPRRGQAEAPDRRLRSPLIFALFRQSSVECPAERRRLREILRDLRKRSGGHRGAAVVGVIVLPPEPPAATPSLAIREPPVSVETETGANKDASVPIVPLEPPAGPAPLGALGHPASLVNSAGSAPQSAAEPLLLAMLFSAFLSAGPPVTPEESPLHTALYRPGDPGTVVGVMEAACRALQAAGTRSDVDVEDEQKIPTILKCFPWMRRRRQSRFLKDGKSVLGEIPQHPDESIALKAICELSNGNCEESHTDI